MDETSNIDIDKYICVPGSYQAGGTLVKGRHKDSNTTCLKIKLIILNFFIKLVRFTFINYFICLDNDSVDDLLDGTTSEDSDSDSADEMVERQKAMAAKRAALGAKKLADLTSVNKSPTSASSKAKFEVGFRFFYLFH